MYNLIMEIYSESDMLRKIKELVKAEGTQKALAKRLKVSTSYLCDVINGRRIIADKFAAKLGYSKMFVPKANGKAEAK